MPPYQAARPVVEQMRCFVFHEREIVHARLHEVLREPETDLPRLAIGGSGARRDRRMLTLREKNPLDRLE